MVSSHLLPKFQSELNFFKDTKEKTRRGRKKGEKKKLKPW